ncbi:MAG: DNA polymerase I [Actinomycetaceae bacterium]|nr:DNA polymerase I [Actinomycetaceae bacterium]
MSKVKDTLLLLDGHSLAFRAFYALKAEHFRSQQGVYTNAVHGFSSTLLKLLKKKKPTHVAVAFDLPGGTFRTEQYSEYKAGRSETPEEFKGQIELIQSMLSLLGVSWFTYENYEADDIVASLVRLGKESKMKVYVASGDKDSFQFVDTLCTVLYPMPRKDMIELDPDGVLEKTGVMPSQYLDLAALVGEKADNLPGVPGVGNKTAVKWLNEYGSLDSIIENSDKIKGKVGDSLRSHLDDVKRNRQLNEMINSLNIVTSIDDLRLKGADQKNFIAFCEELGIRQNREKLLTECGVRADAAQENLLDKYERIDTLSRLISYNVGTSAETAYYLSWQHDIEKKLSYIAVCDAFSRIWASSVEDILLDDLISLQSWLGDPKYVKACYDAKNFLHACQNVGWKVEGIAHDTLIAAYVLQPDQKEYDFTELLQGYVGIAIDETVEEENLLMNQAIAVKELSDVLVKEINEGDMQDIYAIDMSIIPILMKMESCGIYIDMNKMTSLHEDFQRRVENAQQQAYDIIERDDINLSSPKQLSHFLFEELKLPHTKKTKLGYSTNVRALEDVRKKIQYHNGDNYQMGYRFLSALSEHRNVIKMLQSAESLMKCVGKDHRIHTTYTQYGTATGRLASSEPNLQNIHGRSELGKHIREIFVPTPGFQSIMSADYSQIEMRIMVSLSGDNELIDAFKRGDDLHTYVASRVHGVSIEDVTSDQRSHVKAMSYGLVYGLSAFGLSQQLNISMFEAQKLMDDYFGRFGHVKEYLDSLVDDARERGYTQTIFGRRRYFPDLNSMDTNLRTTAERMALNAPIQGTAADIMKRAMFNVTQLMDKHHVRSRLLLQVHDELICEIAQGEEELMRSLLIEGMMNAGEGYLKVPLDIHIGIGDNWLLAEH